MWNYLKAVLLQIYAIFLQCVCSPTHLYLLSLLSFTLLSCGKSCVSFLGFVLFLFFPVLSCVGFCNFSPPKCSIPLSNQSPSAPRISKKSEVANSQKQFKHCFLGMVLYSYHLNEWINETEMSECRTKKCFAKRRWEHTPILVFPREILSLTPNPHLYFLSNASGFLANLELQSLCVFLAPSFLPRGSALLKDPA